MLIPRKQLCKKFMNDVNSMQESSSDTFESLSDVELTDQSSDTLNTSITAIDISPIKTHGVLHHMRVSYGKRKLSGIRNNSPQF